MKANIYIQKQDRVVFSILLILLLSALLPTIAQTRMGIGCTNPTSIFEIRGSEADLIQTFNNTNTSNRSGIQFQNNGTAKFTLGLDNASNNLKIGTTGINTSVRLSINASGYVGIGVADAVQKLHIQETGTSNVMLTLDQTNAGDYDNILRFENGTTFWSAGMRDVDADQFSLCNNADLAANQRFIIKAGGNIALGTLNIASKRLHLYFNTAADNGMTIDQQHATGNSVFDWKLSGTTYAKMGIDNANNDVFEIDNSAFSTTPDFAITSGNNIGIGTDQPTSTFHDKRSFGLATSVKAAAYTAGLWDYFLGLGIAGATTFTLPAISGTEGRMYSFVRSDAATGDLTLDANASENIEGALTYVLTAANQGVVIMNDGTEWKVLTTY